jgi:hypothetical protein
MLHVDADERDLVEVEPKRKRLGVDDRHLLEPH